MKNFIIGVILGGITLLSFQSFDRGFAETRYKELSKTNHVFYVGYNQDLEHQQIMFINTGEKGSCHSIVFKNKVEMEEMNDKIVKMMRGY